MWRCWAATLFLSLCTLIVFFVVGFMIVVINP
jgi:hypothetical protein